MDRKRRKKYLLGCLVVLACLALGYGLIRSFYYVPSGEVPLSANAIQAPKQAITALPTRLHIPKIGVDARVQHVGVTKSGKMATPNNFTDVGWYKYGTVPGNLGSAVIAGHVNNGVALPAVFGKLKELQTGDEVFVLNDAGDRLRYVVTGRSEYDFNARADEVFIGSDSKILRLITCSGVWVKEFGTHNKRLVISAVLSEENYNVNI